MPLNEDCKSYEAMANHSARGFIQVVGPDEKQSMICTETEVYHSYDSHCSKASMEAYINLTGAYLALQSIRTKQGGDEELCKAV